MTTREQQKQALYNQYLDEDFIRRVQQQKQNRLRQAPKTAYSALSTIGDTGKMMSNSSNPNIAKLGSNMYKYSGKEGLDNLKSSLFDKVNSFSNPQSPSAATNTIANAASPNMAATPTITNPATTSLASEFGGAATPTLSNPTAGTTLANFGTQGTTALNGGAFASSSPVTSAIASEASGAGLGAANSGLSALGTEAAMTAGGNGLVGAGTATAGTSAAMGGAGAAGAAGTGAAAGAMGALGAVAAPLAVGYMIWNMINGAKQKKNQEAIELGQKATAENEQLANDGTQEAMQALGQSTDAKREQLKNEINQGVFGDLPNLPGTTMAQDTLPPEMVQMPGGGVGAASDITQEPETNQTDILSGNNLSLKDDILGAVNSGNGLVEQIAGAGRGNDLLTNSPDTTYSQMTPPYVDPRDDMSNTDLAMSATDINDDSIDKIEPNASLKGSLMENVRNGLGNFSAGYKDNSQHGLMDGDLLNGRKEDKTFGQRLGEVFGTGARILRNPYLQGTIAGALYGYDKGDALYGLGKGFEFAQNRMKNNAYVDALRKAGVDIPDTFLGGLSGTDAAAIANLDMLPAKKDYYRGRAAQGLASAGLKADGTPYTAKDVKDMRSLASGDDVDDDMVINPYFKGEQTRYNKGQDVEVSKNNVTASENYVKNGANKVKAAQLGYDTAVQYGKNKNIPTRQDVYHHSDKNNGSPSSQNNSNPQKPAPINTSSNNVKKQGIVDKLIDKTKNKKKMSYTTPSGIRYTVVDEKRYV